MARCVSDLTSSINQDFSAIAVQYSTCEIIEMSQENGFVEEENTLRNSHYQRPNGAPSYGKYRGFGQEAGGVIDEYSKIMG